MEELFFFTDLLNMKNKTNNIKTYIGLRIKFIRNIRQLSIVSAAKILGITRKQFQNYEQGVTDIKISRLQEIADLMNVNVSFFLEGFNDKNHISEFDKNFLINYSKIKNSDIKNTISNLLNELI